MARVSKQGSPYGTRKRRNVIETQDTTRAKLVTPLPGKGEAPLTAEQLSERQKLQEAILHVTKQVMEERREEIIKRAKLRLEFEAVLAETPPKVRR